MPILHSSGGLLYHLRAWRWRRTLWAPFLDQVRRWQTDWRPDARHLVLVGPSGGYAQTRQFLERFPKITVLEPDPVARFILVRRFPDLRFGFANADWLASPSGFARLAETYPDAALLFCNLLGQNPVGGGENFDRRTWLESLAPALAGRAWASWHDLASTTRPPDRQGGLELPGAEPLDSLLGRYWRGGELEIHDHECAGLCPARPRGYAVWHLRSARYHLVEWIACEAGETVGHSR